MTNISFLDDHKSSLFKLKLHILQQKLAHSHVAAGDSLNRKENLQGEEASIQMLFDHLSQ